MWILDIKYRYIFIAKLDVMCLCLLLCLMYQCCMFYLAATTSQSTSPPFSSSIEYSYSGL